MSQHIAPKGLYFTIFAALLVLTGMTVAVTYLDLGAANLGVALGIAVTKAVLVVLFFMHVWWSEKLVKVTVATSVVFLLFLFGFTLADYFGRGLMGVAGR